MTGALDGIPACTSPAKLQPMALSARFAAFPQIFYQFEYLFNV